MSQTIKATRRRRAAPERGRPPSGALTRIMRARKQRGIITASRSTADNRPGRRSWRYLPKIARILTAPPRPSLSRCRGRYRTVQLGTAISCFAAKVPKSRPRTPRRIRGERTSIPGRTRDLPRKGRIHEEEDVTPEGPSISDAHEARERLIITDGSHDTLISRKRELRNLRSSRL